jgi:glutathione S-transferase
LAEYQLYGFAQSGNAYKAALMLALTGSDWEPIFVDYFNGETRTPAFRAINPLGEVPVLVHGARTISQSGVILDYLAARTDRFGWRDEEERREILRWLLFDNHKLTSYIATLRFLVSLQKTGETPVTEFLRGRATNSLKLLDIHLTDRDWLVAGRPTIADLSLCGYLYWPDEFGVSWTDYPAVGRWLERIAALPGWVHPYELMPGHPRPGDS